MFVCLFLLFATVYSTTAPLPLGTVTPHGQITYPTGQNFHSGMTCANVTISCSGLTDIYAIIGVLSPAGASKGLIGLLAGGGGETAFG